MSRTETQPRPFTAATDTFAFAQVFTRSTIRRPGVELTRHGHRFHLPALRRGRQPQAGTGVGAVAE